MKTSRAYLDTLLGFYPLSSITDGGEGRGEKARGLPWFSSIANLKAKLAFLILYLSLGTASLFADAADTNVVAESGPGFHIGQAAFPNGDIIEITSVERSTDRMVVKGHYHLISADNAQLSLFTTTSEAVATPIDPQQVLQISKGAGDFELTHPNLVPGLNHVTMYSVPGGRPFAGIYFGNQEEAAEESQLDLGYYHDETTAESPMTGEVHPNHDGGSPGSTVSMSGPNQILFNYLGNPVEPPANLDARYAPEGLTNAILLAARNAGITVKKVAVDDSEYPFLIGVICHGSDFSKLKAQIKTMDGYEYGGSVGNDSNSDGSDTCNVFSIVPYEVHPRKSRQQIDHRLMLRQQVFYYGLIVQE
jgi:hypothetical protein